MMKQKTKFKQTEVGMIPEDWTVKTIDQIVEIFSGGTPSTKNTEYWNGDICWLSSGETRNNFIDNTERKITLLGVKNSSTRLAKKNDVVIASAGQGHTRGQVSWCLIDTYVNQSVVVLRANSLLINPKFLYYNLKSRYEELRGLSDAHSSRGSLPKNVLVTLNIILPSLAEQRKIGKILYDLDLKIQNLQKMNKILEEIAQTIFKSWFVDYEFPDDNGKPYKSSGGKMIHNEELEKAIPEGWKHGRLENLVNIKTGKGLKRDEFNEDGKYSILGANGELGKTNNYNFDKKLILTGRVGTLGTIYLCEKKCWISDNVLISKPLEKENYFYSFFIMKMIDFESLNRGSTQPLITQSDLKNQQVILPSTKTLIIFHKSAEILFDKITINNHEIQNLSQIRDSLLPKLMSGKIRVPIESK